LRPITTQAEAKLKRESVVGPLAANSAHKAVGEAVRATIVSLGNTPPEDLAAEDHIKEAKKRVKAEEKKLAKSASTMKK
jgi:hypothetical protein